MNKKMITFISIIAIICVIGIIMLIYNYENINFLDQQPSNNTEVTEIPSDTEVADEENNYQDDEQDRELHFDNYIKVEYGEDDMLDKPEDGGITEGEVYHVTGSDISSGFVINKTENIDLSLNLGTSAVLRGADGYTQIEVYEVSPIDTSIQELRVDYLQRNGYNYHSSLDTNDIPYNAPYEDYNGVVDWEQYYNDTQLFYNPTKDGDNHLAIDTITKTAYGNAMLICYYDAGKQSYQAAAYLSVMNNTRIICIEMSDVLLREHVWSYLIEMTNDCIKLVK